MEPVTNRAFLHSFSNDKVDPLVESLSHLWWPEMPTGRPLPVLIIAEDDHSRYPEILHEYIKGVTIDSDLIYEKSEHLVHVTLLVIFKLLRIATDFNLPVILSIKPPLFSKIPSIKQELENKSCNSLFIRIVGYEHLDTKDFQLILDPNRADRTLLPFTIALLNSNVGPFTHLELLAIREVRHHIFSNSQPSPQFTLPPSIQELLPKMVQNVETHLKSLFPLLYEKSENRESLIKKCLTVLIENEPLRLVHAKNIFSEYEQFHYERRLFRFSNSIEFFEDSILALPHEQNLVHVTSLCTGRVNFIASAGPQKLENLSYLWRLAAHLRVKMIVSLTENHEILPLDRLNDPEKGISTELHSCTLVQSRVYLNKIIYKTDQGSQEFAQFQYGAWKDGELISLKELHFSIKKVDSIWNKEQPMLVHCKWGLGRTGVFCACFELYYRFMEHKGKGGSPKEFKPDVWSLVMLMNLQRFNMIYQFSQYQVLFEYIEFLKNQSEATQIV